MLLALSLGLPLSCPPTALAEDAPEHIRKAADLIDDLVPPRANADDARTRIEAAGYFCTWGGSPMLESVGARFLVCTPSCSASVRDGWWIYLSEVVGRGVQFVEVGQAGASIIKPFLPSGCPANAAGAVIPPTR
jgi:hypothetical protein